MKGDAIHVTESVGKSERETGKREARDQPLSFPLVGQNIPAQREQYVSKEMYI